MKSSKTKTFLDRVLQNNLAFGLIVALLVTFSTLSLGGAINTKTTGYRVTGTAQDIFGQSCKKIRTTSGANVFAPTKTTAEWNAFLSKKPSNVSITDCYWNNAYYLYHTSIKNFYPAAYSNSGGYLVNAGGTTTDKLCYYAGLYTGNGWTKGGIRSTFPQCEDCLGWDSCGDNLTYRWYGGKFTRRPACEEGSAVFRYAHTTHTPQLTCATSANASCPARSYAVRDYASESDNSGAKYKYVPCATSHGSRCTTHFCSRGKWHASY